MKSFKVHFPPQNFYLSKFFWLLAYAFSICCFGFYVYLSYYKLNHSPEIIKSTREVDPMNFPFPAITICPSIFSRDNISSYIRARNYFHKKTPLNISEEECAALTANFHWCQPDGLHFAQYHCEHFKYDDINVVQTIRQTSFKFKNLSFYDVMTNQGICYSFNILDPKMIYSNETHEDLKMTSKAAENDTEAEPIWSPERGFNESQNSTILKRATPGQRKTATARLYNRDDENFCVRKKIKAYIHKPNEIITPYHVPHQMNHDDSLWMTVTVKSLRTDPALRSFPIDIRKCYFEGERKLKFFKTYTKILCEWECKANSTLAKCGCVKFSMPRDRDTKVCNVTKMLECQNKVNKNSCNCYAPCNDVEYSYTTESFLYNKDNTGHKYPNASTIGSVSVSIQILMETVEEVENLLSYKIPNFIADFGGFLGLFLGYSLLSILKTLQMMFGGFCSKMRSSRQTTPKEESQNVDNTEMSSMFVTKNDLNCLKAELERKLDKQKEKFDEILLKLDALTKNEMKASKFKTDDELISDVFLEIQEQK